MLQLIPAIDLIEGRCVRLSQGDYAQQTTYEADPTEMIRRFADCGVRRVHVVDLDGAKASAPQNLRTLERLALVDGVEIEWGGGIKTEQALRDVFNAGAAFGIVGSAAAKAPELFRQWLRRFGAERIVLGADIRDGRVSVNGWKDDLDLSIEALIDGFLPDGLTQTICTDISRDGMLQGPNVPLYVDLQAKYPDVDFTVSGGIASMTNIFELADKGLRRVIIGKAIYEGRITLADIERFIVGEGA